VLPGSWADDALASTKTEAVDVSDERVGLAEHKVALHAWGEPPVRAGGVPWVEGQKVLVAFRQGAHRTGQVGDPGRVGCPLRPPGLQTPKARNRSRIGMPTTVSNRGYDHRCAGSGAHGDGPASGACRARPEYAVD
jgi:hypothetical protein